MNRGTKNMTNAVMKYASPTYISAGEQARNNHRAVVAMGIRCPSPSNTPRTLAQQIEAGAQQLDAARAEVARHSSKPPTTTNGRITKASTAPKRGRTLSDYNKGLLLREAMRNEAVLESKMKGLNERGERAERKEAEREEKRIRREAALARAAAAARGEKPKPVAPPMPTTLRNFKQAVGRRGAPRRQPRPRATAEPRPTMEEEDDDESELFGEEAEEETREQMLDEILGVEEDYEVEME